MQSKGNKRVLRNITQFFNDFLLLLSGNTHKKKLFVLSRMTQNIPYRFPFHLSHSTLSRSFPFHLFLFFKKKLCFDSRQFAVAQDNI
jgi:hypothetical protein